MTILEVVGYGGYVIGGVIALASKVKNDNLKDLKDRVEILEKEREDYKQLLITEREQSIKQHTENRESIARLEKEVSIYKDLQLSSIAETNKQILETLQGSATILASSTRARAKAVEQVKSDLEESNPLLVKVDK